MDNYWDCSLPLGRGEAQPKWHTTAISLLSIKSRRIKRIWKKILNVEPYNNDYAVQSDRGKKGLMQLNKIHWPIWHHAKKHIIKSFAQLWRFYHTTRPFDGHEEKGTCYLLLLKERKKEHVFRIVSTSKCYITKNLQEHLLYLLPYNPSSWIQIYALPKQWIIHEYWWDLSKYRCHTQTIHGVRRTCISIFSTIWPVITLWLRFFCLQVSR